MAEARESEVARAGREGTPISVVILDVDHFKEFNDRLGHKCGDIMLQALSDLLRDDSRRSDIVSRYGGEEFVVVLRNTPLAVGTGRAEEWRSMFEGLEVPFEGRLVRATFSAGVACLPRTGRPARPSARRRLRALRVESQRAHTGSPSSASGRATSARKLP